MLKSIFTLIVTEDKDGLFQSPMVMGKEKFDSYPNEEQIAAAIRKHEGSGAHVERTYKLV